MGRFMLFSDSLTKFSDNCINTVVQADDLPKTEVQVSFTGTFNIQKPKWPSKFQSVDSEESHENLKSSRSALIYICMSIWSS